MLYTVMAASVLTAGLYGFRRWDCRREALNKVQVLEAVKALAPYAYGVPIQAWVEEQRGRSISFGGIYAALEDLEDEGTIGAVDGPTRPERGNRRITYFLPKA